MPEGLCWPWLDRRGAARRAGALCLPPGAQAQIVGGAGTATAAADRRGLLRAALLRGGLQERGLLP